MFCLNSITPYDITEYCIVGLKTIDSNIKFFIFHLICVLAKIVTTFEMVFPAVMVSSGPTGDTDVTMFGVKWYWH